MLTINTPKSSVIEKIAYDGIFCHLFVTFKSGSIYRYISVPKSIIDGFTDVLAKDESAGKYYRANIRGKFDSVRL